VQLRDVEVEGRRVDVRIDGGVIGAIEPSSRRVDGGGAALLPGLHDHHVHLLATAAALDSVVAGPPQVRSRADLVAALAAADGWVRAVGYDESVAGPLDRAAVDGLRADTPVRIQHRSGALWTLNSAAVEALGLDDAADAGTDLPEAVERDAAGRVTGRVWRGDDWLGDRMRAAGVHRSAPVLARVGTLLARCGVTGVTDATPTQSPATIGALSAAHLTGALPQRITLLAADAERVPGRAWAVGPAKIVVADHALPGLDELTDRIRAARAQDRAVAVHCVTHEALLLTLAALEDVGVRPGDRVEHAAVAPPEAVRRLAAAGVAVVTQPSLPALRGDEYLDGVDAADRPYLWPYRSLLDAGVRVGCSSDAPYGDPDPWAGVRAAVRRRTPSGRPIGAGERVTAAVALAGYLSAPEHPGGPPRAVRPGQPADLVLLDAPLAEVLADPDASRVRATLVGGQVVHGSA